MNIKSKNSFEIDRQVEHLKSALSSDEKNYDERDLKEEIKQSYSDEISENNQEIIKSNENILLISDNGLKDIKINNNKEKKLTKKNSKNFLRKIKELDDNKGKSKSKGIEIVKIDHSKSKSKDYSNNDKEKDINQSQVSKKYKKTNLRAAFGKLLNEKNLNSELRNNFLKSLVKLNDNDTKEIAFSELKDLINTFCTPEALRIYLNSLSTNYSTCTLAAKEIQSILLGYIASVFKDNLLDSLDKPQNILKTVARMCDILSNYLKVIFNILNFKLFLYKSEKLFKIVIINYFLVDI